ncbi:hypothetical protein EHQ46_15795 [Leptospira yanagawae]|uniref:Uncharacterized protein n=1 Tax=Leptospira yanagawae TaxID=293069 RepID=A0ABY2M1Z1_9LEPT|nr:hypothetical protein [Leptospira yanagawae]TGL17918.1 hypothetical protein EHQ46_15795 [Leptospira yanagawae]
MIELKRQSDNDQFISTEAAEQYYLNTEIIPKCSVCEIVVAYHEKEDTWAEFACHGNILRFYFVDGHLARVEEL